MVIPLASYVPLYNKLSMYIPLVKGECYNEPISVSKSSPQMLTH